MSEQIIYDMTNLRHMLGMQSNIKQRDWGYRNYFNSTEAGPDYESMLRLEAQALVRRGQRCYWHATEAGCKAVGLTEKQIKKVFDK